ncbi:hypothetical protein JSY14_09850 [Brachybacterium sp. EF45031]|uniref:hypothetical protein n=1 Tax=Brachybacterium sillae TaxID=2810536 RepID=UPI00217D6C20|nr:hypothetical protein [Brachybacterium sillae]MCS6712306.1 hypothetical protein [Brachybacterium sillae]
MSTFWGMETEHARAHAERLRAGGISIVEMSRRVETRIGSMPWFGPDAEDFCNRWRQLRAGLLHSCTQSLDELSFRLEGEAAEQDVTSGRDGTDPGPAQPVRILPVTEVGEGGAGYLHEDTPWIPNWLEHPAELRVASAVESGIDTLMGAGGLLSDGISDAGDRFGWEMDGVEQFHRDAEHAAQAYADWVTGERVPTYAELIASHALVLGAGGTALYEMATGHDTGFLDDRPGGQIHSITTDAAPQPSPQSLRDLILENNALRRANPTRRALETGSIGIQEIRPASGGEPAFIVQIPPTEGADIRDVPGAWGRQGNSRDWASNVRLVAGQDVAAMDDVRAAMARAGIPPGAKVMLVGHSQGGIIGNHLAADPTFNNTSGVEGSYNVTHVFSVGSPVQTVAPAHPGTQSVNVSHTIDADPSGLSGDYIAGLDLGGAQIDGRMLAAPNQHEVSLPGYPQATTNPISVLAHNHDALGDDGETDLGYAGSVARHTMTDPTLRALQEDLTGVYIGDGTYVARSHVVEVGRGAP